MKRIFGIAMACFMAMGAGAQEKWLSFKGEEGREKHPVLKLVKDVFGPSDVYGVKHLTDQDTVLLRGAVTDSLAPDSKAVQGEKNALMMALAWLHTYEAPVDDKTGRALCTTMGASVDFLSEDLRRLIINGSFYLLDLEVPEKADVSFVDAFSPSFYGFWNGENAKIWKERALTPAAFALGEIPTAPEPKGSPEWGFSLVKK